MRFHMGVSFSFRKLKKFLFPILVGILAYFLGSKFELLSVYAATNYTNLDTNYNITVNEIDFNQIYSTNTPLGDISYIDFYNNILLLNSEYYYVSLNYLYSSDIISVSLIPRQLNDSDLYYNIYGNNRQSGLRLWTTSSQIPFYGYDFTFQKNIDNIFNSQEYLDLVNCYVGNVCPSSYIDDNGSVSNITAFYPYITTDYIGFNNDDSFDTTYNGDIIFYTDLPYSYNSSFIYQTNTAYNYYYYIKSIYINGKKLENGDPIPTYSNIFNMKPTTDEFPKVMNHLPYLYFKVEKSELSNFKTSIDFDSYEINYQSSFFTQFFGRTNNGEYYLYERISCSFEQNSWRMDNYNSNFALSGIICSSDISNYDYIYSNVSFDYYGNDNINKNIYNFNFTSNAQNYYKEGGGYDIYESFNNLPTSYRIWLSSKNLSLAQVYSSNEYTNYSAYDLNLNYNITYSYNSQYRNPFPMSYGTEINRLYLIHNNSTNTDTTQLNLLFNYNTLVSTNLNGNNGYYFDSNGNITNSNFTIEDNLIEDNYNVNYYFNIVNNYIDSLSSDMVEFSNIVQNVYDRIPNQYQIIIFTLFILGCVMIIYKIIKE